MPDVSRSDSQRSDSSARPRVSFNRDVHVKRIGTAGAPRVVGALAGDASGRLLPLAVRRERPTRLSRRDLAKEAQRVLEQADKVTCTSQSLGLPVDKYSTLPPLRRKKPHRLVKPQPHSLREKNARVVSELIREGNSSSSTERGSSVKRARTSLARSASDVGDTLDDNKTKFWSLDRLRSRKKKTADVDRTQIASILSKKSHSDSEKTSRDSETGSLTNRKKKQLSPIIEASPREDYFARSDEVKVDAPKRPTKEPKVPNRSRKSVKNTDTSVKIKESDVANSSVTSDKMETILHSSQTISKPLLTRGRTVDTMVRKLSQDRAGRGPPRVVSPLALVGSPGEDRQHNNNLPFSYTEPPLDSLLGDSVILHNGYAKGVNEKDKYAVPTSLAPTKDNPTSEVLDGGEPTQVIYAQVICNGGGKAGGALTKQTVHTSVQPLAKDAAPMNKYASSNGGYRNDYVAEGRGRGDGMDSRRNLLEDESYRRVSPIRRNLMEDFINNEGNRSYSYNDARIEPVLQKPRLVGNLDLSSRRDRLESRIESQRKDRLLASRSHQDINDSRVIDNHRKYPSNPRLDSEYNNRREFLNSQLNHSNNDVVVGRTYSGEDHRHSNNKDQLTDSGIDINYHGGLEVSGGGGKVITELRSYHNTYETTTNTDFNVRVPKPKASKASRQPTVTNVTKVDVNGHIKPEGSDDEDDDVDVSPKYYYNQQENIDQIKKRGGGGGLSSTKLVQETKRTADVLPPSAVLIRHFAPAEDEWTEERNRSKRKCEDLGDVIEETRRFLAEERRRSLEDDAGRRRPEKVEVRAKKSGAMDKVRALFSRGGDAKKKKKTTVTKEDPLTSRYVEYKGSSVELDRATPTPRQTGRSAGYKASSSHLHVEEGSRSRRERLPTPSPSPSRPATLNRRVIEQDNNTGSWFKSLDRLRGKNKPKPKIEHQAAISENEDEHAKTFVSRQQQHNNNNNNNNVDKTNKNLRFFGDTDAESVRSHKVVKPMTSLPENPSPAARYEGGSQQSSTRYVPLRDSSNNRRYKSGNNNKLQVPRRRHHRSAGELATSSAESTTEGDSSQQSQRSVVYLHAATVGDIPGRAPSRNGRRARSREELSSTNGSTVAQPQTRTVSRSISVLAPWKPRHYREGMEVHYENGGKPPKAPPKSTSTLGRLKTTGSKDKENLSRKSLNSLGREGRRDKLGSTDSLGRDGGKGSRRVLTNAQSIESLKGRGARLPNGLNASAVELDGSKGGYRSGGATTLKKGKTTEGTKKRADLSRSVSMPKDAKVKSGWFRRKTRS